MGRQLVITDPPDQTKFALVLRQPQLDQLAQAPRHNVTFTTAEFCAILRHIP